MVKGLFHTGNKSPFQSLWLRMRTFQWCFHWLQGTKVSSIPMESEKPDGSSAQVPYSSFCDRKWLGVLLLSLDGMVVHCRWPPAIVRLPSQIGQYHLYSSGGERHWEGKVSCLRTWQGDPSLGSIVDLLIGSPTDKPLSHQLPTPTHPPLPQYPLPTLTKKSL